MPGDDEEEGPGAGGEDGIHEAAPAEDIHMNLSLSLYIYIYIYTCIFRYNKIK